MICVYPCQRLPSLGCESPLFGQQVYFIEFLFLITCQGGQIWDKQISYQCYLFSVLFHEKNAKQYTSVMHLIAVTIVQVPYSVSIHLLHYTHQLRLNLGVVS